LQNAKSQFIDIKDTGKVRKRPHSQRNAETAGEFVFNLVTFELRTQMNQTGADVDETISEPETAGLAMAPSRLVKAPPVALSTMASSSMACSMFGACARSLGSATWITLSLTMHSPCSGSEPELVRGYTPLQ
jgi:hypothetical protein